MPNQYIKFLWVSICLAVVLLAGGCATTDVAQNLSVDDYDPETMKTMPAGRMPSN